MRTVLPDGNRAGLEVAEPLRESVTGLMPVVLLEVILLLVLDTMSTSSALL